MLWSEFLSTCELHCLEQQVCLDGESIERNSVLFVIISGSCYPLMNFVSIYAVQAALMQLFTCIVNKGCCLPFRYPPCHYTTICIMNFVFTILAFVLAVAALVTVLQVETIFQNLVIPLTHLVFVLVSVCTIQLTLAASMWVTGPKDDREEQEL